MGYLPDESDIFAWAEQQQISCCFLVGVQVTNTPMPGYYVGELSIGAKGYEFRSIKLTQNTAGKTWVSVYMVIDGEWVWTDWIPYATATPPQVYDLPLVEGVTSYGISSYCKTQENVVIMNFAVVFADVKAGSGSYLFAILPAGFRPNGVIVTSASAWCESPLGRNAVECDVRQDGGIYISTTEQSIQYVHGQVVFVAG